MRWRPCKPADREWYARCLTAVEDIPTEAMLAGIDWNWETFPEYLANVERLPKGLNYGMYIGHSALRMYAMGRRALDEKATEDDLRAMERAVTEAIRAGALGFSTSRATTHVTPDDTPVASRIGDWAEIERLASVMGALNSGIFHMWTAPSSQDVLQCFDQIACVHMSGLLVRSHMNAGQDGFRDKSSKQNADLIAGHWKIRSFSRRGSIDHTICSLSCKFLQQPARVHLCCAPRVPVDSRLRLSTWRAQLLRRSFPL